MPRLDFDRITLGHGSGGLLTNRLLDKVVFELLGNDQLDQRHDGAVLECEGPMAFTTDSFVVSPVQFPGGNIGELAINGTVNDLAMCGAMPHSLSLALILEEGLPLSELWDILLGIKSACAAAGVRIVTGDTKVVERGKGDKVFINTTGLGHVHPRARIGSRHVEPGDRIIVSGPVATHGIAIMSVREGLAFETTIESDTRPLHEPVRALLDAFGPDIHLLRDPTRGGVATVLNEVARDTGLGIRIEQAAIPIEAQVEGACEMLGLDPLYVANEGIFLAFAKKDIAAQAVHLLRQRDDTARAAIIGEVVEAHPKQVVLKSRIGGTRVVNMLTGEQLPRIC
ncbi:MAG: hydrogenase expression/formation protein HypE [Bacteroidetes bacterium]|nr:MAG: hydrogenase expression/formation protein HypE [Bacteroidota bacterium]